MRRLEFMAALCGGRARPAEVPGLVQNFDQNKLLIS